MHRPVDVSVVLLTYNHERFIAQAIEGVLAQEDVAFELVVTEDCSTDRTREIVREYAARFPGRVRALLAPRNGGMNLTLARGIEAARGRYVALLDGDDYWTSPQKLRRQVDFLDAHPECAICFHNVMVVYEDGTAPHPFHVARPTHRVSRPVPKPVSTLADVAPGNFLQTCSVVFRRGLFGAFPPWYTGLVVGDWPLHVLNAEHGDIGYLDEVLAAYRVHPGGVWSGSLSRLARREHVRALHDAYVTLDRHLGGRFAPEFARRIGALYLEAAIANRRAGRFRDALHYAGRHLAQLPPHERLLPQALIRAFLEPLRRRAARVRSRLWRVPGRPRDTGAP